MSRRTVAWDTETFPIGTEHGIYPRMVCSSFAERVNGEIVETLWGNGDPELFTTLQELFESNALIVGHNVGGYDLAVLCNMFPTLEPLVWAKLERNEITCTMIREQLKAISSTGRLDFVELPDGSQLRRDFSLAGLVLQYLEMDISDTKGEDTWRMQFILLDGLKAGAYPKDAADYARGDATYTLQCFELQEALKKDHGNGSIINDGFHTAAHFALSLMTETGCRIDAAEFHRLKAYYEDLVSEKNLPLLSSSGIMRPAEPARPHARQAARARELGWPGCTRESLEAQGIKFTDGKRSSINEKLLHEHVVKVCAEFGVAVLRTDTGAVCCNEAVQTELAAYDKTMKEYRHRQAQQKMLTTYLPQMETTKGSGVPAETVHAGFKALISTLRTSSFMSEKYPSWNGQNVDPRAKLAVIPREGNVICATDYSTLELVTFAQVSFDLFGKSVHKDKLDRGFDLHAYLGAALMKRLDAAFRDATLELEGDELYKLFASFKKSEHEAEQKFYKLGRKVAKPTGLGNLGGLGPERFIIQAGKKPYYVDVIEIASQMPESYFEVTEQMLYYFMKLYRPGVSADEFPTAEEFEWKPMMKAIYLALDLREVWFDTYPEAKEYFSFISENMKDPDNPVLGYTKNKKPIQGYCYPSPTGEHIAGCLYTEVCNGFALQTPAAVGAKLATIKVVRACRDHTQNSILLGSMPLLFIHDELLIEFPADDLMHERAMEIRRLMEVAMKTVVPDVPIKAAPALMDRWNKDAEPEFDDVGRLVIWRPRPSKAA